MKKIFSRIGVQSKDDTLILASFVCLFLGLIIQIIIIVGSFFWSREQFGYPNVSPLLFIFATITSSLPSLGPVAFVVFTFIIFKDGLIPFNHPWFYQWIGMAIFNIGMLMFLNMDKILEWRESRSASSKRDS
jgi:hypothetical protein